MRTLVDTDALLGLINTHDALHKRAKGVVKEFVRQKVTIFVLPTTLGEFATISSIRLGFQESKKVINLIAKSGYIPLDVTGDMVLEATALYQEQTSKENSLFDCFNMVAADKHSIDCIFSFDRGYTQNGFLLAEAYLNLTPTR